MPLLRPLSAPLDLHSIPMASDPCYNLSVKWHPSEAPLDISDFMALDGVEVDFTHPIPLPENNHRNPLPNGAITIDGSSDGGGNSGACKRQRTKEETRKSTFRVKTDIEALEDGYKWRKYGKKTVKNNPNLRNYYRCSSEGCVVKKRVQRDHRDSSYVIITYEGNHNHLPPSPAISSRQPSSNQRP